MSQDAILGIVRLDFLSAFNWRVNQENSLKLSSCAILTPASDMLKRLYIHNYRCLQNFEFQPQGQASCLLLGKNGVGKSAVRDALRLFQLIGQGQTSVAQLLKKSDFFLGAEDAPVRFVLEVGLKSGVFVYELSLDWPLGFREPRVLQEILTVGEYEVFRRSQAEVAVNRDEGAAKSVFSMNWHLVALPIIHDRSAVNPIEDFTHWLTRMVLVAPSPQAMVSETSEVAAHVSLDASNMVDWMSALLDTHPMAYATIVEYLQGIMPDLELFRFEKIGRDQKGLLVKFRTDTAFELRFDQLSDGEKCFFLAAVLIAANRWNGPVFAFWDEPDNFLATHEVDQFVMAMRRNFMKHDGGQLLMSSHHPQAIGCFGEDNTWVLGRKSHLEPAMIRLLGDVLRSRQSTSAEGDRPDVIQSLLLGDLEP